MFVIIDYGVGNIYNVEKIFVYLGVQVILIVDLVKILVSDGLIFFGVGVFNVVMINLK